MEQYKPPTTKLAFQSDKKYHVFLSFRGPDVRKTLVDHLYEALTQAGLIVFLDSEKLEKGEMIGLSLNSAIESSVIRIPIFSKGYADSGWCLKEAAAMLRTPGLIIPLFYHVNQADVRYPEKGSSPYNQSFLKHSDRFPREEIEEWKSALQQICCRSGWSMDITQGYEARLVKTVVNDLRKTLDRVPFEVAKHPVGTDNVKNAIIQKLNLDAVEEVVKAGIWGIGGIGKTTVAKAVYNQVYGDFDAACFVFNVRVNAENPRDLTNLQKQILKNLSKYDGEVSSIDDGKTLFKERLGRKHVLLILDDMDAVVQLDALVGDWLARGSRVIITSKNKHILNLAGISSECIQEMTGLKINEGLQLFSWHAFLRPSPNPSFEDLSKRIAEACKGHPLSLEVIGSFLYDKQDNMGYWTEALHNISLNQDIHDRLYISYSALCDDEKEIFVDIACFFIGEHKTLPIVFWISLYNRVDPALHNLSMKLLVKIDDEGVFDMHDHLRDMGRTIAEKEKKGTRLWEAADLSNISNNIKCSRLRLNGGIPQRLKMLYRPGLCYLHLQNLPAKSMTEDLLAMLPTSLIWLRLEHCSSATGMNRATKKILTATRKMSRALSKPRHSRSGGNNKQLKIMQLKDINNLSISSLFSLPNIQLVQHLDLEERISLKNLPGTIGNLSQLRHLDLGGCGSLNNLSDMIGNLSQLQHLDLKSCKSLQSLPNTIGKLSQLQHLNLGWCEKLKSLPDTIGNLSQLQFLGLGWCDSLNSLPDTIGKLSQLQFLDLGRCRSLNNLPDTIGNLSQLRHLDMGWCDRLNNLPDTFGNLTQLQHLELAGCKSLNKLPDTTGNLSQLQHLDLGANGSLNNLPDTIGTLSQLQHLDLRWCDRLNNLPDTIGNLSQLQHLDLGRCDSLNNLPDTIGNLSQLQHLGLGRCTSLNNLPDTIGNLSQLQHLDMRWCDRLNNLPDTIGNLSRLQHLDLGSPS
ncbi:disease resistance protein RUN1 [Cryptomeria japonica]|uniref:disease resistance protein RUN1 n=1 Tax=Cryptomeria japonica TaxID=3369 RepID=UPI0027DA824C|nr:disease resistance protein RUN1 [Cryptomeria japonica]